MRARKVRKCKKRRDSNSPPKRFLVIRVHLRGLLQLLNQFILRGLVLFGIEVDDECVDHFSFSFSLLYLLVFSRVLKRLNGFGRRTGQEVVVYYRTGSNEVSGCCLSSSPSKQSGRLWQSLEGHLKTSLVGALMPRPLGLVRESWWTCNHATLEDEFHEW